MCRLQIRVRLVCILPTCFPCFQMSWWVEFGYFRNCCSSALKTLKTRNVVTCCCDCETRYFPPRKNMNFKSFETCKWNETEDITVLWKVIPYRQDKEPTRCNTYEVYSMFFSSTRFGHQYSHHQEYNIANYRILCPAQKRDINREVWFCGVVCLGVHLNTSPQHQTSRVISLFCAGYRMR
jgi:hypothetical protein